MAVGVVALTIATTTAGCGESAGAGEADTSDSAVAATPTAVDDGSDDAVAGDGAATAVVVLGDVTYQFEEGPGTCREVSGGLIAALLLTRIDDTPAPDGAGTFDMSLYPDGLQERSQISVKLPDGRFGAGYNEIGMEWPSITVERDGLKAGGSQSLTTHTGEQHEATVEVDCG